MNAEWFIEILRYTAHQPRSEGRDEGAASLEALARVLETRIRLLDEEHLRAAGWTPNPEVRSET